MLRPINLINAARAAIEAAARAAAAAAAEAAARAAAQQAAQQQASEAASKPAPPPPAPPTPQPAAAPANVTPTVAQPQVAPAVANGSQSPFANPQVNPTPVFFTAGGNPNSFNLTDLLAPQNGAPQPDVQTVAAPAEGGQDTEAEASEIVEQVTGGLSIEQIAEERGMSRQQVLDALQSGGMTVNENAPTSDNGDVQTTTITQENGETVTQYYDYHHDNYHTEVTDADGHTTSETPVRDGSGRKVNTSHDAETGQTTTTYEDDLGDGTVTEEVAMPDGTKVETVTPGSDPTGQGTQTTTTVTAPGGETVELDPDQTPGGESTQSVQEALEQGQSIDQIAEDLGLTPEQVQAELQAAGYTVETTQPSSDNGDVQSTTLTDAQTGEEITYTRDWQHDVTTTTTTNGETVTTHSETGNGVVTDRTENTETGEVEQTVVDPANQTTTTTTIDADGRKTVTTEVVQGDGEPNPYEVEEGDNLTQIAAANGMTLEELRELNPELFEDRDPNIINPGETVMVNDPVETTVEVTFNDYTVTTAPNGEVTVFDHENDYSVTLEAGSVPADLADLLTQVNPNSSDPEEAKEAEVTLEILEGIFAGEGVPQLTEEAEELAAAREEAIETYGEGHAVQPTFDQNQQIIDPYGDPPTLPLASGGDWVPVSINGEMRWVHPEVARAILAENAVLSKVSELQTLALQASAQSNVYALDPAYADAQDGAAETLNEVLNPHGLQWNPQQPDMTLEEAQTKLEEAQDLVQNARDAREAYESAIPALEDAIVANNELEPLLNPDAPIVSAPGQAPSQQERENDYAQGVADHAAVDELFAAVNLAIAQGDDATLDLAVGQADYFGMDKSSEQYQNLVDMRDAAAGQVELAQAYSDYFATNSEFTLSEAQRTDLEGQLLTEYNGNNQHLFEPDREHYTNGGTYLGTLTDQHVENRDGQLWVINTFSSGKTTEQQLTYALSEDNVNDDYRDRDLNQDWQEFLTSNGTAGNVCTVDGSGLESARASAAINLTEVWQENTQSTIDNLETSLQPLQETLNDAMTEHGTGTTELPDGAMPDDVEPVSVEVGGQTIKVSPEVAEQINAGNIEALAQSEAPVFVTIDITPDNGVDDGEGRWVAPEVALAALDLSSTRQQIAELEDFKSDLALMIDHHEFVRNNPDATDQNAPGAMLEALENDEQITLDGGFQAQFQALAEAGLDGTFDRQDGEALENTIEQTLGLDPTDDEARAIIESVAEEIRDIGGDNPDVARVPMFYVDENGSHQTALFAVHDDNGDTLYVDVTGKKFSDIQDFQDNNDQFAEDGRIVVADNLDMAADSDGTIDLDVHQARIVSTMDKVVDPIVGIGTGIATVLSFTPAAPVAAPLAIAGGTYLGGRAIYKQYEHINHGGEWNDGQSLMNIATVATTVLPMGASGLRAVTMARGGMTAGNAVRYSVGAYSMNSSIAAQARNFAQSSHLANRVAYGMDAAAVTSGVPMLGISTYDLAVNGSEMNGLELANAITGLGTGVFGTGLGIHGLRTMRPGTATAGETGYGHGQTGPDVLVPDAVIPPPGQSDTAIVHAGDRGRPMAVHEMGPDGVYRPTGEVVYHDAAHPVIAGETVGGGNKGPRGYDPSVVVDDVTTGSVVRPALDAAPHQPAAEAQPPVSPVTGGQRPAAKIQAASDGPDGGYSGSSQQALDLYAASNGLNASDYRWRWQSGANGQPDTIVLQRSRAGSGLPKLTLTTGPDGLPVVAPKARPLNQKVGDAAETHAVETFRKRGYTTMLTVQNQSGHGVDVFMYNPTLKKYVIAEIKANSSPLSGDQLLGTGYAIERMIRAADGEGQWRSASEGDKLKAETALQEMLVGEARDDMHYLVIRYDVDRTTLEVSNPRHAVWGTQEGISDGVNAFEVDGQPVYARDLWDIDGPEVFSPRDAEWLPGDGVPGNPEPQVPATEPSGPLAIEAAPQRLAIEAGPAGNGQGAIGPASPDAGGGPVAPTWSISADGTISPVNAIANGTASTAPNGPVNAAVNGTPPIAAPVVTQGNQGNAPQAPATGSAPKPATTGPSPSQVAGLNRAELQALSAEQVAALTPEALGVIKPRKIGSLNPAGVAGWDAAQIGALSPQQVSRLSVDQIKAMTADQFAAFSNDQWTSLSATQGKALTSDQLALVSENHYARLPDKALAKINPDAIGRQDIQFIGDYSADKLKALGFDQIRALTPEQVAAIDPEQLGLMSADHIRKFSAEQFTWMTPEQRAALSTEQVKAMRNTNKNTLTETERASLTPEQQEALLASRQGNLTDAQAQLFKDTLKAANRRELKYFTTSAAFTTTGIVGVHAALPPQLSVPVAAAGLVVRGSVSAIQGMFKNATYDNKTLGRILNGIYGASFFATGQTGFQNPATSTPSLVSSFFNSPKGVIRAATGQTMMRTWSARVADPAGMLGGLTIIATNSDNPVAVGAGALIALTSGESFVRGVRTEHVRKTPFPTDKPGQEQLDASNKRWDRSRMIAGFVGFAGIGGYVTSLLAEDDPQGTNQPDPGSPTPSADPTSPTPDNTPTTQATEPDPSEPGETIEPTDPQEPTQPQEPEEATYPQFVVKPGTGLNLRANPDDEAPIVTVFSSGSFVDQAGEIVTDAEGRSWIPVEGFGQDGSFGAGWVPADHVAAHAEGESDAQGRYNPNLEGEGLQWIVVSDGDTIRSIAIANDADIVDTVALNLDHIMEPDLVFKGDRIYLPAA